MPGFPDYFLVHREAGTHWIFECKVKGRNLTRLQHTWIQALKDAGFNASVVTEDDWWTGKLHQRLVELASPMTAPVVPLLKAA
jgi:hypothetical protein